MNTVFQIVLIAIVIGVAAFVFRPKRRFTFRDPEGAIVTFLLSRKWKRKILPSAPYAFENMRNGSILQVSIFPSSATAQVQPKMAYAVSATMKEVERTSTILSDLVTFESRNTNGLYFFSEDRFVKPGGYAYMASGMILTSNRICSFTILSHFVPPKGIADGMAALGGLQIFPSS